MISGAFIGAEGSPETETGGAPSGSSEGGPWLAFSLGNLRGSIEGTDTSGGGNRMPGPGPRLGLCGSNTPLVDVLLGVLGGFFDSVMEKRTFPLVDEAQDIVDQRCNITDGAREARWLLV
jgi:hypothetical protein